MTPDEQLHIVRRRAHEIVGNGIAAWREEMLVTAIVAIDGIERIREDVARLEKILRHIEYHTCVDSLSEDETVEGTVDGE